MNTYVWFAGQECSLRYLYLGPPQGDLTAPGTIWGTIYSLNKTGHEVDTLAHVRNNYVYTPDGARVCPFFDLQML